MKATLLKFTFLFLLILSGANAFAQKNTVSAGGVATGAGGSATYSIGQIDYITASGAGGSASQGVQQVFRVSLNLKYFIQGYYDLGGLMKPVLFNQGIDPNPTSVYVDTVTIELHNAVAPYALAHSYTGLLHTDGTIACSFPNALAGSSYYIVLTHRNSIATWSASPVVLNDAVAYDFSTAANKAYGSNQIQISPSIFAVYNGDINQDENEDLLDLSSLETEINNFTFGYAVADLNGDGNVDLLDDPLLEDNITNFVFAAHP